jgi:hypothetical protein
MEYIEGVELLDSITEPPHGCYTEDDAKELFR